MVTKFCNMGCFFVFCLDMFYIQFVNGSMKEIIYVMQQKEFKLCSCSQSHLVSLISMLPQLTRLTTNAICTSLLKGSTTKWFSNKMARCVTYGENTEKNTKLSAWNLQASTANPTNQNWVFEGIGWMIQIWKQHKSCKSYIFSTVPDLPQPTMHFWSENEY
jgi:hypothetical protein